MHTLAVRTVQAADNLAPRNAQHAPALSLLEQYEINAEQVLQFSPADVLELHFKRW
jgi:hypothetical protein